MNEIKNVPAGSPESVPPRQIPVKVWLWCGAVLAMLLIGVISYNSGRGARIGAVAAKSAVSAKLAQDSEYKSASSALQALNAKLSSQGAVSSALAAYQSSSSALDAALNAENGKIEAAKVQLSSAQAQVSAAQQQAAAAQSQLNTLNGAIVKAKGAPKVLPAGQFIVGKDIPAGRYSVTGNSNFVVYDAGGNITVNTILGDGDYRVTQYVCTLDEGDSIRAEGSDTFTPVQ